MQFSIPPEPLVPEVDISPFLADSHSVAAEQVVEAVRNACRKTGFLQIVGHGLPMHFQQKLFKSAQKFFALPQEEKLKLDAHTTIGRRGYDVLESQAYHADTLPDLKESFFVGPDIPLDDPVVQARRFFMGPNVWPDSSQLPEDEFKEHVENYFDAINELAIRVLEIVERSLPYGPGIFDEFTKGHTVSVLRMLHYPPPTQTSSMGKLQKGAGAHTDFGAITLLLQDEYPGLEVLDPATNEFVAIEPCPNALVFNVGDMLSYWTGGVYRSSVHRVINKAKTDRYSAAFFYDGALDCTLAPLGQQVNTASKADIFTVEKHMN